MATRSHDGHGSAVLQVLDVQLRVECEVPGILSALRLLLGQFESIDASAPLRAATLVARVAEEPRGSGRLVVSVDGHESLSGSGIMATPAAGGWVYANLLQAITARVRTHLLVHAGAVAWAGRGVILAGKAGRGKTTLALALCRHGYALLSDDVAALGRQDRLLHPYLRAVHALPESLDLCGLSRDVGESVLWSGKRAFPVHAVGGVVSTAVPVRHVIVLRDARDSDPSHGEMIYVVLTTADGALVDDVGRVQGVLSVRQAPAGENPSLIVRVVGGPAVVRRVGEVCAEHGAEVLAVGEYGDGQASFAGPTCLSPLDPRDGIQALLRHLHPASAWGVVGQDLGGDWLRAYMEVAGVVGAADFHQLRVGPLTEMTGLVRELCEAR